MSVLVETADPTNHSRTGVNVPPGSLKLANARLASDSSL